MVESFLFEEEDVVESVKDKFYLTKSRVVKHTSSCWGSEDFKDLKLEHITVLGYEKRRYLPLTIVGIILLLLSFLLSNFSGFQPALFLLFSVIGIILIIGGLITKKNYIVKNLDGTEFKLPDSSQSKKFLTKIRELQD